MTVVTRFPPSPTGSMHVGNARTALYNWLYAKHHGGKFVLRIEDTDRARHSEEAVQVIYDSLGWLDLSWDGEPVSQHSCIDRHAAIAKELLASGKAYHCYCSPDELEEMRETAKTEGRQTVYDRRWRDRDAADAPTDIKPVIRIKAPIDGQSSISDEVQGDVTVQNETLDDFIIMRSDGTPTYMLAVVVDDHDMGVTHVLRGDDHLNNAFRQKVIYDSMGWDLPVYGHLPMILGPDGGKLSKRHGATGLQEFQDMGYLPEAVFNYLLRLGWSHGDDEIISRAQAIEWFDLDHVGKSPAGFDFAKLENLNGHYITEADNQRLLDLISPALSDKFTLDDTVKQRLLTGMDELKDRAKTLLQLTEEAQFYCYSDEYEFTEKAQTMLDGDALTCLLTLKEQFTTLDSFINDNIQQSCKIVADELRNGKLGKVAMPLRAALTGTTVSPSIFHAAEILGKDETLKRLDYALRKFTG